MVERAHPTGLQLAQLLIAKGTLLLDVADSSQRVEVGNSSTIHKLPSTEEQP